MRITEHALQMGVTDIDLPIGAEVHGVGLSLSGRPLVFVLVGECEETISRRFLVVSTGQSIEAMSLKSLGTLIRQDELIFHFMVLHIFEVLQ